MTSIGKGFFHLVNLHTQSSNPNMANRIFVESFVCRYEQLKETRRYMQQKIFDDSTNYNEQTDLVILLGDTNVCALSNYPAPGQMQ